MCVFVCLIDCLFVCLIVLLCLLVGRFVCLFVRLFVCWFILFVCLSCFFILLILILHCLLLQTFRRPQFRVKDGKRVSRSVCLLACLFVRSIAIFAMIRCFFFFLRLAACFLAGFISLSLRHMCIALAQCSLLVLAQRSLLVFTERSLLAQRIYIYTYIHIYT